MDPMDLLLDFFLVFFLCFFYFLPSLIAFKRQHPQRWAITMINLFLGCTIFGWVVAIVWAVSHIKK